MSDLTDYPRQDKFETTLSQDLNSSSTSVYLTTPPSFSLAGGQSCEMIIDYNSSTKYERCTISGPYTGGTNPLTVTRGRAKYSGGSSTATTHSGGAKVIIGPTYADLENAATAINTKMDKTGGTFTGSIDFSGSSTTLRVPNLTTAQRTGLSASNGMIVYDTDLGVHYQYIGGSWSTFATGSVVNAADHTAGKVDIASATEMQNGTATDGTSGALNVVPVSQTTKTSSGASDHGKVPVLDSSGKLATGFVPSGTDATKVALSTYSGKGSILAASAASTPANVNVGSDNQVLIADSSQSSGVKWGTIPLLGSNYKSGTTTKDSSNTTTTTIAHGLGRIPARADINAKIAFANSGVWLNADTTYNGTTQTSSSVTVNNGNTTAIATTFTLQNATASGCTGTVTMDATNITITWSGTSSGTWTLFWKVEG